MADNTAPAETITTPAAAPGTIDAALDDYIGQRDAPVEQDNAPEPSEVSDVNDAAPEIELEDDAFEQAPEHSTAEETSEPVEHEPEQAAPPEEPQRSTEEVEAEQDRMRQADYTRKTQELAEHRKQVEAQYQQVQQQQQEAVGVLQMWDNMFAETEPPEPDHQLSITDPVAYLEQKDARRDWDDNRRAIQEARQRAEHEQMQYAAQQRSQIQQQNAAKLIQLEQGLDTKEKLEEYQRTNFKYATEKIGYTPQEMDNLLDYRAAILINKARLYDEAKERAKSKRSHVQPNASPSIRQSQTQSSVNAPALSAVKKADQQHTRQGTVESAVKFLQAQREAKAQ